MRNGWVYSDDALGTFVRQGATHLQFWCVTPNCLNRDTVPIAALTARYGPRVPLVMLARKARCRRCGRRGCHVQPAPPPVRGQPGYQEWVRRHGARDEPP
jgi:hypothetical protein